jgi:hypothetical protein
MCWVADFQLVPADRERQFLFQRFSIAIQRFNSICFHGSFLEEAISDHDT